jgi:hypothetical protein
MRIDRSLLNWGVFLIALGGVPLAVQQGLADSGIAGDVWRLWPLILVGIGLGLLLRWTPLAWLGGAIVAGTFGLIFGALVAGGITGISGACGDPGDDAMTSSQSGLASSTAFDVELSLSCGQLTVTRDGESRWSVTARHADGEDPTIDGDTSGLSVRQDEGGSQAMVFGPANRNEWQVQLPNVPSVGLDVTLNAADATLDLGGGPIGVVNGAFNATSVTLAMAEATANGTAAIDLSFNASSGTVSLPAASVIAKVDANLSSVTLCIPSAAPLRVELDSTLSSDDLDSAGLEQQGEGWQTPDYDTASARVDLDVSSAVSSLTIQRPEVCS